jgi:hypothetical protein
MLVLSPCALCVCICISSIVARQQLSKRVSEASNTHEAVGKFLEASVSTVSLQCEKRAGD